MGEWWQRFRRWPSWAQALVWAVAWPAPLLLLAAARPERRRTWIGIAVAGSLLWVALVADRPASRHADDRAAATDTTGTTSTTREHIATTTTTTEPADLGPVPDPDEPIEGYATAPGATGGLSTAGAGTFDVDALVGRLTVASPGADVGYDRSLFEHWTDDDGDGCDTRAEVLQAESDRPVETTGGCHVERGWWLSIYDGYSTDDASELDIDHLVALHEAWVSGAAAWGPERRQAFANDLGHPGALVAVTAAMNRSKGDRDPARWQPPNRSAWCLYAADWITVKERWGLTADPAEATALRNMLHGCGAAPTTTTTATPTTTTTTTAPPTTTAPTTTTVAASSRCDPAYPDVCIPSPPPDLDCGDIPYRRFRVLAPDPHGFDGNDNDGIGCESG